MTKEKSAENKINILIVDDEEIMRDLFARTLEGKGRKVVTAENGKEAVKEARKTRFDIAFIDIKMPDESGVETFKKIKKLNPKTQVFMMTAFEVPQDIETALSDGALGALFKPFDTSDVLEAVEKRKCRLTRLPVRVNGEMLLLDVDEIFYVKAKYNGAEIHTRDTNYWARLTLKDLEDRLGQEKFFRTHRSYLVNVDKIKKVGLLSREGIVLVMKDEKQSRVPVSRSQIQNVKKLLGIK